MIFGTIISAVSSLGKTWLENKKIKNQQKMQLAEAQVKAEIKKIELSAEETKGDTNYDLEVLKNQKHTLKDEYALLIVTLPFVLSFIPFTQDYIVKGWEYLQQAPSWYSGIFVGSIAGSLGLRFITKKLFK